MNKVKRESGLELLKILALFLVIVAGAIQTITTKIPDRTSVYYLALGAPTVDRSAIFITALSQAGNIAANIFFICSAWFFVGEKEFRTKKAVIIWSDTFIISLLWLLASTYTAIDVGNEYTLKSFLPNLYGNNWYITLYLIFLFIYPFLNRAAEALTKRQHFIAFAVLFIVGVAACCYFPKMPFSSYLTVWVSLYIGIAYLKTYGIRLCDSMLVNMFFIVFGFLGTAGVTVYLNFKGLNDFNGSPDLLLKWNSLSNPFVIMLCFGLFNIFRRIRFKSRFINYISSTSLFVYLIHDNILLREFYRPKIWSEIAVRFELYDHYIKWIFIYSASMFLVLIVISILYKESAKRIFTFLVSEICKCLERLFNKALNLIVK